MQLRRSAWFGLLFPLLQACSPPATDPIQMNEMVRMQAGGWTAADAFNVDVQEAARFAVQKQALATQTRLIYKDVLTAQTQIVAGLNFQMKVLVTDKDSPRYAMITVGRNVQNQYTLLQWNWTRD